MNTSDSFKEIVYLQDAPPDVEGISGRLYIALSPSAYACLKEKGVEVRNTLDYLNNDSHKELLLKSQVIVDWLRQKFESANFNIDVHGSYRDAFIFLTRFAIHYCLEKIEIISNTIEKHKPGSTYAPLYANKATPSVRIEFEEEYLTLLARRIAKIKGLRFEEILGDKSDNSTHSTKRMPSALKFISRCIAFQMCGKMFLMKNIFRREKPLLLTAGHEMGAILTEFRNNGINIPYYFLQGPITAYTEVPNFLINLFWRTYSNQITEQKRNFENLINEIENQTNIFSYRDIPFADIISKKMREDIVPYMVNQFIWLTELDKFIERIKPSVILSNGARRDDIMIAELCRSKKIPDILISHGSHVRPKNESERIEWGEHGRSFLRGPFSNFALQTPLAEGYFEVFPAQASITKTGPILWGRPADIEKGKMLFNKMFKEKYDFGNVRVILYAATQKLSSVPRFHVYETPDEYVKTVLDLTEAVRNLPRTILIVKFRPRKGITTKDLKRLVPFSEKVILSVGEKFSDVLGMSDLLVSFSSTTIEEALQNRIPVLLYGGQGRYQHVSSFEVKKNETVVPSAAYHVKRSQDLEYAISHILDLEIRKSSHRRIFDPYIYDEHSRISITDLVKVAVQGNFAKQEG